MQQLSKKIYIVLFFYASVSVAHYGSRVNLSGGGSDGCSFMEQKNTLSRGLLARLSLRSLRGAVMQYSENRSKVEPKKLFFHGKDFVNRDF